MSTQPAPALVISGAIAVDQTGERRVDVRIADGRIAEVGDSIEPREGDDRIDASGLVLSPGFVDLHTHLREPGKEEAETIETGSRAAALGGYTAIVAMPASLRIRSAKGTWYMRP